MPVTSASTARDAILADLADRIVHIARRLNARQQQDPQIVTLSPLEALVLRHVDLNTDISSSQLAADLELRSSNASAVLRSLIEKDLIHRHTDPHDRRGARFELTAAAHDSIDRLRSVWARALGGGALDDLDLGAVLAALTQMESSLNGPPTITVSTTHDHASAGAYRPIPHE